MQILRSLCKTSSHETQKIFMGDGDIESYNVCMNFFPKKFVHLSFCASAKLKDLTKLGDAAKNAETVRRIRYVCNVCTVCKYAIPALKNSVWMRN